MKRDKKILKLCIVYLCILTFPGMLYTLQVDAGQTGRLEQAVEENTDVLGNTTIPQDITISENMSVFDNTSGILITQTSADITVIPDKNNTGCKGELTTVEIGSKVNGIQFVAGSNGTRHVLDFGYRNKEVEGTVYFENYDFSNFSLWSYNENKAEKEIKVVFNNCKFSGISTGKVESNLFFEFNNCTINSFSGSNTTFNQCRFGNSYSDGLVPFINIEVNDCFFADMGSVAASGKEVHTDGTQIYGIAGTDVENVHYRNCRFEIPSLFIEGSTAYINACIMLQLEYSNAKDLSFTDCIVNGGGYSIYARDKGVGYTFEDVIFEGIQFGCAKKYGIFYPDIHSSIKIEDVSQTDSLYIASVWKENGETHLSVSNDTNRERTLVIYTDKKQYTYSIPACPNGGELTSDMVYADMPFDMDIVISEDCEYIVCYDHTINGCGKQIRFVNWSEQDVYLNKDSIENMTLGQDEVLLEGNCGKNVSFTLTKGGILTLSGTGSTENYHSAKSPAWIDYIDYIKEVRVLEGIEGLGSMLFRNCTNIKTVTLPESLKTINQRVFAGCVCLTEFTLPANITELGTAVFSGTVLSEIKYEGENWEQVTLGTGNENLESKVVYYHDGQIYYRINYVLNDTTEEPANNENQQTYTAGNESVFNSPIREGYAFEGWFADEALSIKKEGIVTSDTGNKTIYAKWTKIREENTEQVTGNQPEMPDRTVTETPGTGTNEVTGSSNGSSNETVGENTSDKQNEQTKESELEKLKPKKISGLKVKKQSNTSLKISWKKVKKASGYQIAIKTGKKGKYKIVKTIKKNATVSYTKKKLKKGKTYYIKVRAYKRVNGKKVYGEFSKVKKIKLK